MVGAAKKMHLPLVTVNSRYCRRSQDRDLVPVLAWCEKKNLENEFMGRRLFAFTFKVPTSARTRSNVIYIYKQNSITINQTELCAVPRNLPINPHGFPQ